MSKEEGKYLELFYGEALENSEDLNKNFAILEQDTSNRQTIENIFRITHTLKGNAMGLGLKGIGELSHVMEDIFAEIKDGNIVLDKELFDVLFRANDKLSDLIQAIKSNKRVSYKGIRTKLSVYLNKQRESSTPVKSEPAEQKQADAGDEGMEFFDNMVEEKPVSEEQSEKEDDGFEIFDEVVNLEEEQEAEYESDGSADNKLFFSDQIQVSISKLDGLLNLVGELMIEKDSLLSAAESGTLTRNKFGRLNRITSDLQYGVMNVRLVQIGFFFNKFYRTVRDVANIENKKVSLALEGTEIEIDRNILKSISDSMIHLIRNAVSHGIESPEDRIKSGKPEQGTITLSGSYDKDSVIIQVSDDGGGIDAEAIKNKALSKGIISDQYADSLSEEDALMLIFEPGFSNAETITEVSGRGVGMDVVKRSVESTGGRVNVRTEIGVGTTIELVLPSSMALKGALLFELDSQPFAIPLSYTEAVISIEKSAIRKIGNGLMTRYLDRTISVVYLRDIFEMNSMSEVNDTSKLHRSYDALNDDINVNVIVVSYNNNWMGIVVDKLLQQKEIVEKTLGKPLHNSTLFTGATILGNGNVCLVLDSSNILRSFYQDKLRR